MSVENLYSYLEYLNLAIDQLEEVVASREEEEKALAQQLDIQNRSLTEAHSEIDRLQAQLQVTAQQAEVQIKSLEAQLMAQAQQHATALKMAQANIPSSPAAAPMQTSTSPTKTKAPPQDDLFDSWTQTPTKAPARTNVANDQNALILAKKLDSTIDKVQRLIGQGK